MRISAETICRHLRRVHRHRRQPGQVGPGRAHIFAVRILPWQRGIDENAALCSAVFARGINCHQITAGMLHKVAQRLNDRPRNGLRCQSPAAVFHHALTGLHLQLECTEP